MYDYARKLTGLALMAILEGKSPEEISEGDSKLTNDVCKAMDAVKNADNGIIIDYF